MVLSAVVHNELNKLSSLPALPPTPTPTPHPPIPHPHTHTQVGFGDVVPQNLVENIVVIIVEVIGVLFFGLLISSIRQAH